MQIKKGIFIGPGTLALALGCVGRGHLDEVPGKRKNTAEISDMCHKTEEPIYITKNGYGDMVIMSMEVYEKAMRREKMYHDLAISEQQIKEGKTMNAEDALLAMRKKYGLCSGGYGTCK